MDSDKFKTLLTAIKTGSLTATAEQLGYSQAGITHMMNRLEADLGLRLLTRDKYGVKLTEDGESLLPYIEEFIRYSDKLEKEIYKTAQKRVHTIKIASYASIINHKLPKFMSLFKEKYPNVNFVIKEDIPSEIYKLVRLGRVDMGFVSKRDDEDVEFTHLKNDPLLAVLPNNIFGEVKPDYAKAEIFGRYPVLVPTMGYDMDMYSYFTKNVISPLITNTSVNDAGVVSMVESGLGVSILSELILKDNTKNVTILPLYPKMSRDLGIITQVSCSPFVKEFRDLCVECAENDITWKEYDY